MIKNKMFDYEAGVEDDDNLFDLLEEAIEIASNIKYEDAMYEKYALNELENYPDDMGYFINCDIYSFNNYLKELDDTEEWKVPTNINDILLNKAYEIVSAIESDDKIFGIDKYMESHIVVSSKIILREFKEENYTSAFIESSCNSDYEKDRLTSCFENFADKSNGYCPLEKDIYDICLNEWLNSTDNSDFTHADFSIDLSNLNNRHIKTLKSIIKIIDKQIENGFNVFD